MLGAFERRNCFARETSGDVNIILCNKKSTHSEVLTESLEKLCKAF